jgi:hypothetical protein
MRRRRSEAIEIRQRDIRQGEREIRQRDASKIREKIRGGGANDGQGKQEHRQCRHPARSPLRCRRRLIILLRCFIRCFSHLHSLRVRPGARVFLAAISKTKKAAAWTIQRRLSARQPSQIRLKSWAHMVNDQLFPAVSRARRSAAGGRRSALAQCSPAARRKAAGLRLRVRGRRMEITPQGRRAGVGRRQTRP